MSTTTVAAGAATTNWRTYDGVVPQSLRFYAIFFPVVMAAVIVLPTAICYFCLSRGRPVPYTPLNTPGGFGTHFFFPFPSYVWFRSRQSPRHHIFPPNSAQTRSGW